MSLSKSNRLRNEIVKEFKQIKGVGVSEYAKDLIDELLSVVPDSHLNSLRLQVLSNSDARWFKGSLNFSDVIYYIKKAMYEATVEFVNNEIKGLDGLGKIQRLKDYLTKFYPPESHVLESSISIYTLRKMAINCKYVSYWKDRVSPSVGLNSLDDVRVPD